MSEEERNGLIKQRRILREKCEKKDKEIERLNNIINELEKYLDEALGQDMYRYDFKIILDKLQELKDSDKE